MDPTSVLFDEARKGITRSYRWAGPLLVQAGLLSLLAGRGGRPTDTLTRAAAFVGLPTTWVENVSVWFDDPIRHRGLVLATAGVTLLLMLSLGVWAGRWRGESQALQSTLRRAGEDDAARSQVFDRSSEYLAARAAGTGSSVWLGVALLLELQALNLLYVFLTFAAVISIAILSQTSDTYPSLEPPGFVQAIPGTLLELGMIAYLALVLSLISPERRLANAMIFRP